MKTRYYAANDHTLHFVTLLYRVPPDDHIQLRAIRYLFHPQTFSVGMARTVRELRGESCLEFDEFQPAKQEICCSRSFGQRVTDYIEMRQAIVSYATRAAEKLRGEHQFCRY